MNKEFITKDGKKIKSSDNKEIMVRKEQIMPANNKFKFQLFTGSDPDSQYSAVATKDPLTFYLLNNGKGYLGTTQLFGGSMMSPVRIITSAGTYTTFEQGKMYAIAVDGVIIGENESASPKGIYYATSTTALEDLTLASFTTAITNYIANNAISSTDATLTTDGASYEGSDSTIMTSKAVTTFVNAVMDDVSILHSQFFRTVELHTVTAQELQDAVIHFAVTDQVGDTGLLFTRDDDMTDNPSGDTTQEQFFVNLKGYIDVYTGGATNEITVSVDANNEITATLNKKTGENSIIIDSNGVSLNKTDTIHDGDGTDANNPVPSADKLVTEEALMTYLQGTFLTTINAAISVALEDVVTYINNGDSATGVTLDQDTLSMTVGGSDVTLVATVSPSTAQNKSVTWTSSDDSVATVTDGVVHAVAAGTATITATTVDGSFTDTCTVTVSAS